MSAALSIAPYALELLEGPVREGRGLGHGYVAFGDDVIAATAPGAPRLPVGIECGLTVGLSEAAWIGGGELTTASGTVTRGPVWDPRPRREHRVLVSPFPELDPERLLGWGPGLTPLGDDILAGRLANGGDGPASLAGTTRLSRALLRRAALGELAEPVHALLQSGDPAPLLAYGSTSGTGLLLGLAERGEPGPERFGLALTLPDGPMRFVVSLC